MAGDGSLLERIRHRQVREDIDAREEPAEIARSVGRNFERILNAWAGSALVDPALGMPDDAFMGPDSEMIGRRVADEVARNVKAYEPRLGEVVVRPVPPEGGGAWTFVIQGRLLTVAGRPRVQFEMRRDELRYSIVF